MQALPGETLLIPFNLLAYQPGTLLLPPVTLSSTRYNAEVDALHGRTIFVAPEEVGDDV
jgi:hypothetical protein